MNVFLPRTCGFSPTVTESWSLVKKKMLSKSTFTVKDLINTHVGTSFDLQPLPQRMQAADPVADPSLSRIYVRYINSLQQKALYEDFAIDIAKDILTHPGPDGGEEAWETFTYGEYGGRGVVHGLHTGKIPISVRKQVIAGMLSYCERILFYYVEYKALQYYP